MKQHTQLSGWANYPVMDSEVLTSADYAEIRQYVLENEQVIARGNGKSYGDAALGQHVVSTLALNRIIEFNATEGIMECAAGVLLSDLLPVIVPAGFFFHVTPGIKHITVGGAIASDVHGKNHPAKGCFSNWLISFQLMTANGEIRTCSREENAAVFWQTCGGMGWTGIILSARFQLMPIRSSRVLQRTIQCGNLEAIFQTFADHLHSSYAVGWIDTTASGSRFGRGAVHLAEHATDDVSPVWEEKQVRSVPFYAPFWLLNPVSIRAFNALYFRKNRTAENVVDIDASFYPLDSLLHWNRLYGRRGFVQYQFCVPETQAFDSIRHVLETVRRSPETPFLSVLKRHGERPKEAVHSFPEKGYSLALDFPRTRSIFELVKKLDTLVWDAGGKIYLTKDACSNAAMGRIDPNGFGDPRFSSALRERIAR